jgi:hypothetical protein
METVRRLRAMASLCRQSARVSSGPSWKLLAEAEYLEHRANNAFVEHFEDCTAGSMIWPLESKSSGDFLRHRSVKTLALLTSQTEKSWAATAS